MDRYKYQSYKPENSCFVYSYSMPAELSLKEISKSKKKRRNLNRFIRRNQNKNKITNKLQCYDITSSEKTEQVNPTKNTILKLKNLNVNNIEKTLKNIKIKNLNCCKIS